MKTRSKFLLMLLVFVLAFALVACGGEKDPAVDGTENAEGTKAPEVTKAPVTTAPPETEPPVVAVDPFEDTKYKADDYYALYVQDGLLLHLNFATANEGTAPIVGGESYNNPEVSAAKRFTGADSNYTPFIVYSTIENPVNGGTAKILTPWYFENWYKDGFFDTNKSGSGKIEDMQTEEPLEYAREGDRSGTKVYIRNTNMYHTDFYYNDDVWVRQTNASYWGNGFLGVGAGSLLNVGQKLHKELAGGYTLDVALSGNDARFFVGGRLYLSSKDGAIYANLSEGNYITEKYAPVVLEKTIIGCVNSVTLSVETLGETSANFTLYGNGVSAGTQTLAIGKIETLHQYCSSSDFRLYATRIYNRALTAEEVAQNHFADVAIQNKLDIEAFLKLDDAGKLKVYEAFSGEVIDSGYDYLQPILDAAVK